MSVQKTELWGTFSVKDHLRRRPFVAEVLLYDRLLIPRPPTKEEEAPGPGEDDQVTRWRKAKWNPSKLRKLLEILQERDLAIDLPWSKQAREDWENLYYGAKDPELGTKRSQYSQSVMETARAAEPDQVPYVVTAGVVALYVANELQNEVSQKIWAKMPPDASVEPVIAYRSYRKFKNEQSINLVARSVPGEELQPYTMFGWEFFVPEDSDKDDVTLLKEAIKLAARPDFREARQYFHGWLAHLHEGGVDPETARVEMLKMLKEYRSYMKAEFPKAVVRWAAKIAPVFLSLVGLVPEVGKEVVVAAEVAAESAGLAVDWLIPTNEPDMRMRSAALVNQARRFFGKKVIS